MKASKEKCHLLISGSGNITIKGTAVQIEKVLTKDRLRVSKVS